MGMLKKTNKKDPDKIFIIISLTVIVIIPSFFIINSTDSKTNKSFSIVEESYSNIDDNYYNNINQDLNKEELDRLKTELDSTKIKRDVRISEAKKEKQQEVLKNNIILINNMVDNAIGKSITEKSQSIEDDDLNKRELLLNTALNYIGVPYVWGGTNSSGLDCSGFVQLVFNECGYRLPRVSAEQSKTGELVSRKNLLPGDLLFFDTRSSRDSNDITTPTKEMQYAKQIEDGQVYNVVSHVGIYVGNNKMIHASSGDGYITYADLESNYYKNRFINARRIIE